MFKTIRFAIEQMKAVQEVNSRFMYTPKKVQVGTFTVIHDHALVRAHGSLGAIAIVMNYMWGTKQEIVVDDFFFSFSSETQMAIIMHEMGHIECGHLLSDKTNKTRMIGRFMTVLTGKVWYEEIEADEWAAHRIGYDVMANALEELGTHLKNREIKKRIKLLLKNKGQ